MVPQKKATIAVMNAQLELAATYTESSGISIVKNQSYIRGERVLRVEDAGKILQESGQKDDEEARTCNHTSNRSNWDP